MQRSGFSSSANNFRTMKRSVCSPRGLSFTNPLSIVALAVQEVERSRQVNIVLDRLEPLFPMGGFTAPQACSFLGVKEPYSVN